MQSRLETEEAERRGYRPEEYRELVRRAQEIRAAKEGEISRDLLVESAAEVGIREEDLREAERQVAEEKAREAERQAERAARQRQMRTVGAGVAGLLGLFSMFSFNSLNGQRLQVDQARSNLQSTLQRRADLVPNVVRMAREGAAHEQKILELVNGAQERLKSPDLGTQLEGSRALNEAVAQLGADPKLRGSGLYEGAMDELAGSENRINVARQRYNEAATRYNGAAQSFPNSLFRPLFGMPGKVPYYQPPANVEAPPRF